MRLTRTILTLTLSLPLTLSALDVVFQPTLASNERFKDIGGQPFGAGYISSYSYSQASVVLTLNQNGLKYLDGTLTATGLKPNFAYQVKLAGRPSHSGQTAEEAAAADDASNERIGRVGRWWRGAPTQGNSNDGEYDLKKSDPTYLFQGYMPIAFFVTDASGSASVRVLGNNSYHVLWRTDQRPETSNDGPPLDINVPSTTGSAAYDVSLGARNYTLYGEWEPTRALPGQLVMMDGTYNCDLALTEESFHDSGTLAGAWTSVLHSAVTFTIPTAFDSQPTDPGTDPTTPSPNPLTISHVRLVVVNNKTARDTGLADFVADIPSSVSLNGIVVETTLQGVTRRYTLSKSGRGGDSQGRITAKRDRHKPTQVKFHTTFAKSDFVFATDPIPAQPTLSLSLVANTTQYAGEVPATVRGKTRITMQFRL